jgi:hypothetical protein
MDLSKLSDDQLRVATKIIAESEKQGVNPDHVIPMAMAENMFKNDTSPANALGPMQLTVGRAKLLNVDPKNEDENIRGGVTFFKQLYSDKKVGGNDPERLDRVYAAYNAGPGTAFVKTGDLKDLPDETLNYLMNIKQFATGTPAGSTASKDEAAKQDPWAFDYKLFSDKQQAKKPAYGFDVPQDIIGGAIGAGIGGGLGASYTLGKNVSGVSRAIQDMPEALRALALKESFPVPTDPMHTRQMQGTTDQGASGRARMNTFNEQTAQTAASRADQERTIAALVKQGVLDEGTAKSLLAKSAGVTATPSGVLLPSGVVYEPAATPPPPKPTLTQQVSGGLKSTGNAIGNVLNTPVMRGGLGGLGIGAGGMETANRVRQGDIPGAVLSGLGTAASAAGMFPPAAIPATMVGLGSAGALATLDKARNKMASEAPPMPITPREEQMYQKPFFGKPKQSPLQYNGALLQELDQQMKQFSSRP